MKLRWTIFCCLVTAMSGLRAQQIPTSFLAPHTPALYNPAAHGATGQHQVHLQSRQLNPATPGPTWFTRSLAYSSPARGRHHNKGWGALVQSHREGMVVRHDVRLGMSVQLLHKGWRHRHQDQLRTTTLRIAIGGYGGLIAGGANYSPLLRQDHFDPLLDPVPVAYALDAGLGLDLQYTRHHLRWGLSLHNAQLPSDTSFGLRMLPAPHLLLQSKLSYTLQKGLDLGMAAMWVHALRPIPEQFRSSLDLHLRADFTQHRFWVLLGLRQPIPALVAGGGLCLLQPQPHRAQHRLDLSFILAYPQGATHRYGLAAEIGLQWRFGTAPTQLRPTQLVRR